VRQQDWAIDDIILGSLLGAWLGGRAQLWLDPLNGALVAATVVVLAYCGRSVLAGSRRLRLVFALPAGLACCLIWMESLGGLLDWGSLVRIVAILAVWVASLGMRALGDLLGRGNGAPPTQRP